MSDCSFYKCRGDFRLMLAFILMTAAAIALLGQMESRIHYSELEGAERILPAATSVEIDGDEVRYERYPL
ncbi:MAG: hypothetical protein RIM33_18315 [Alphaproteobacteria bacterium]